MVDETTHNNSDANDIAIVAMAALLPGAYSLPLYWSNLCDTAQPITKLSRAKLLAAQAPRDMMIKPGNTDIFNFPVPPTLAKRMKTKPARTDMANRKVPCARPQGLAS